MTYELCSLKKTVAGEILMWKLTRYKGLVGLTSEKKQELSQR